MTLYNMKSFSYEEHSTIVNIRLKILVMWTISYFICRASFLIGVSLHSSNQHQRLESLIQNINNTAVNSIFLIQALYSRNLSVLPEFRVFVLLDPWVKERENAETGFNLLEIGNSRSLVNLVSWVGWRGSVVCHVCWETFSLALVRSFSV